MTGSSGTKKGQKKVLPAMLDDRGSFDANSELQNVTFIS
jgi:hypothetical protein